MEIFCRNIPEQVQENHLKKEFAPTLARFSIYAYSCRKLTRRNALLTVGDAQKAQMLLNYYGQDQGRARRSSQLLKLFGGTVYMQKSRNEPDEFLLRSLREEEENRRTRRPINITVSEAEAVKRRKAFFITSMSCGSWDYEAGGRPIFWDYFRLGSEGKIVFGRRSLRITISSSMPALTHHVEFEYSNTPSIHLGSFGTPSITITCDTAPRMYITDPMVVMANAMASLRLRGVRPAPPKVRVGHFGGDHEAAVGTCFTYRFLLRDATDMYSVRHLNNDRHIPDMDRWVDECKQPPVAYRAQMDLFMSHLANLPVPYRIKFQLQRLVWNGDIPPARMLRLFPFVHKLVETTEVEVVAQALERLVGKLQYAAPDVESADVEAEKIATTLSDIIENFGSDQVSSSNRARTHPNNASIHKAQVTPSGIYLYGPSAEGKNRVLRKYADHIDHFLRVEFLDESGDPVRFDPRASLDDIFRNRFKGILTRGINIGGRVFHFLGFSHSSLRSQTCWFVAQFTENDEVLDAHSIIEKLGSFGHIRSPAKQAARIGQAFSDTLTSIQISKDIIRVIPDITRNGRVFSDGVGTISYDTIYKIWKEYALRAQVKPTVFQIRLGGAKGMISLDSRRPGHSLELRPSMVKFDAAPDAWNIEICGSGINRLPCFLNRQLIKILEDLGVNPSAFLELQEEEVDRLRDAAKSPEEAANFIEQSHVPKSARLPWLIRVLQGLGLRHTQDSFLRRVMELAALVKLRDLKYRARIPVARAVTLYGIMDETGFLKEGEIFCPVLSDDGSREILVRPNVIITRCPALHPGDVQLVGAVDVPLNSPLRKLHNCVVFSQHGDRDLPSMLSGGDLDGDLYHIIYDPRLTPRMIHDPADYPGVKETLLDRPVTKDDIIDFFLTFMQQDQLGRIATIHQTLADQRLQGTLDDTCLLLAELHSIAVDFSKSGTPVDLALIPKNPRYRPDFMAPGTRVHVAESIELLEEKAAVIADDEDDEEQPEMRYYRSNNILGKLFRAVDEQEFLETLQQSSGDTTDVLDAVWIYVQSETIGFQWDHLNNAVQTIKEIYEDNLWDLMQRYSATPWKDAITEFEVFIGDILGQGQKQNKRQREASRSMREEYDSLVEFIISRIIDEESDRDESLERSIACFWLAMQDRKQRSGGKTTKKAGRATAGKSRDSLLSFTWIAAIACLTEVDKFQRSIPF